MGNKSSNFGCGALLAIVIVVISIVFTVKKCNQKREYKNTSWYQETQLIEKQREDSIKKLNELSKSNPDEYNRIMREYDEQIRKQKMWKYSTENDGDNVRATIKSENDATITLPEPIKKSSKRFNPIKYIGKCLIIAKHTKAKGNEIIINIPKMDFNDESPSKRHILAWFDDAETPIIYDYFDGAKEGYAFLKKSNDFIEHCKKSTHIKLEIPITYVLKNFDVVYEFEIPEPLIWEYTK